MKVLNVQQCVHTQDFMQTSQALKRAKRDHGNEWKTGNKWK